MHLLKNGRAAFLDYLRNLTPQALLFTMAVLASNRLELTCCYWENAGQTALFLFFMLIGFAAVWANASVFIENYLISLNPIDLESKRLISEGVKGFAHFKALSAYAWREHRSFFWEVIVVAAIVEAGVVVPLFFAIGNSAALLRAFHA